MASKIRVSGWVSIYQEFVEKKKKRVLGLKFLGFLGDGFGVKENKKAGKGGLCPTVMGTHSYIVSTTTHIYLPSCHQVPYLLTYLDGNLLSFA
jgi:hypothetical protein